MTDGHVSFHRESGHRQRGHVDAEVLREHGHRAGAGSEHPLADDDVVLDERRQRSRDEQHDVGQRQRHEVPVGRRAHLWDADDDGHDQRVAGETDDEDEADEQRADESIEQRVVADVVVASGRHRRPVAQTRVHHAVQLNRVTISVTEG